MDRDLGGLLVSYSVVEMIVAGVVWFRIYPPRAGREQCASGDWPLVDQIYHIAILPWAFPR